MFSPPLPFEGAQAVVHQIIQYVPIPVIVMRKKAALLTLS